MPFIVIIKKIYTCSKCVFFDPNGVIWKFLRMEIEVLRITTVQNFFFCVIVIGCSSEESLVVKTCTYKHFDASLFYILLVKKCFDWNFKFENLSILINKGGI